MLAEAASILPAQGTGGTSAPPGHPFFGAAFLFVGSLLVVEMLAGAVWRRSRLRTMLWPASLIAAGLGLLVVVCVQPTERSLHLALALLLLMGGVTEGRYRLGHIPRSTADVVAIPSLVLGGLVIGPMHANGPLLSSVAAQTHLLVGVVGFLLAAIRFLQVRLGYAPALDATFGAGVMALGFSLLLVEQLHHH